MKYPLAFCFVGNNPDRGYQVSQQLVFLLFLWNFEIADLPRSGEKMQMCTTRVKRGGLSWIMIVILWTSV